MEFKQKLAGGHVKNSAFNDAGCDVGCEAMRMESDRDLLERMKSLIHVTKRVHIKDAAAMLDVDRVTFLKKVMEWCKTIPFKIDGDDIVVDDVAAVVESIDKQFSQWGMENGLVHNKLESPVPSASLARSASRGNANDGEVDIGREVDEAKHLVVEHYMPPSDPQLEKPARHLPRSIKVPLCALCITVPLCSLCFLGDPFGFFVLAPFLILPPLVLLIVFSILHWIKEISTCKMCGKVNERTAIFCLYCGMKL
jgi:hypothetical protein